MDILFKLRIFFWGLVLTLWGMLMYQFMKADISSGMPEFRLLKNPFGPPAAAALVKVKKISPATAYEVKKSCSTPRTPPVAPGGLLLPIAPDDIKGAAEKPAETGERDSFEEKESPVQEAQNPSTPWPAPPNGFAASETKHFLVYQEGTEITKDLLSSLETLHGNIMLDLVAFSPWDRDEKVLVYFFKTQKNYRKITGRPSWSGGASSLSRRVIYIYESEEAFGILAHELCHVYFDSFFGADRPNPLWLSEGVATFIQTERGMSPPNWLRENLGRISEGGGFKLNDLMRVEDTRGAGDASVRIWYAQAYSVVRFMMRMKAGDSFYQFCRMLRDGRQVGEALFRSYGMPYNRVAALEYAWRYDLKTRRLTQLTEVRAR